MVVLLLIVRLSDLHGEDARGISGGKAAGVTGEHRRAAPRHHRARVRVLPFVRRHDDRRVVRRSLHPLLHSTHSTSATIVAPVTGKERNKSITDIYKTYMNSAKYRIFFFFYDRYIHAIGIQEPGRNQIGKKLPRIWTVFHSFLPVFTPSIPVFQMIYFALCHECVSGFSLPLLGLLLRL